MAMHLSERLETVIRMVTPGHTAVDVGCDHGFVAIRLVSDGISPRAVASDLREGPLQAARKHVDEAGLSGRISVVCADGVPGNLSALTSPGPVTIILAGMGGILMTDILDLAFKRHLLFDEIVASPQRDAETLRRCLMRHAFLIEEEQFVREDGKNYQIIRAEKKREDSEIPSLSIEELRYGPCLLLNGGAKYEAFLYERRSQVLTVLKRIDGTSASERISSRRQELEAELAVLTRAIRRIHPADKDAEWK